MHFITLAYSIVKYFSVVGGVGNGLGSGNYFCGVQPFITVRKFASQSATVFILSLDKGWKGEYIRVIGKTERNEG